MGDHKNSHVTRQLPPVEAPTAVALVLAEGQSLNVQIVDFSPDGAGLSSRAELAIPRGQDAQVLLTPSTRRFAHITRTGWTDGEYRIDVEWKYAHHRDAAGTMHHDEGLPDFSRQFYTNLPAQFYTLWQLIDHGRPHDFVDVLDQFERAAERPRPDLVEKTQAIKAAIENSATDVFVASLLDELCTVCVRPPIACDPDPPAPNPTLADCGPCADDRCKEFLGTSAWVLGTFLVLAGHLLTII